MVASTTAQAREDIFPREWLLLASLDESSGAVLYLVYISLLQPATTWTRMNLEPWSGQPVTPKPVTWAGIIRAHISVRQ